MLRDVPAWIEQVVRPVLIEEARRTGEIPLLPQVAREAMSMASQPEVPIRQIANTLSRDAALAAHLLRVANSPLYGSGPKVSRLPEALVRLGVQGLRQMLYAAAARRVLSVNGRPAMSNRLQNRAFGVAVAASGIGGTLSADPDGCFVAGLLHDVGWAVIHGLAARKDPRLPEILKDEARVDEVAEHLHEEVGEVLAESWNLPPQIVAAIGYHHHPAGAVAGSQMAHIVAAAVRICDALQIQPFDPPEFPLEQDPVLRKLALTTEQVARVKRRVTTELEGHRAVG
jgi:HD-like signal output (HDOD) protein